jgi:hypothetical protein
MKALSLISLASTILLLFCGQQGEIIINVADHGVEANTKQNTVAAINRLIEGLDENPVLIVFPEGRYDFYPDSNYLKHYYETNTYDINPKRLAVFMEKKKNITIDASGSDFIFHDHIQPFTLDNAENITIKNVNIDWDFPLTAESEVIEADDSHVLLKIDTAQFPYRVNKDGITFLCEGSEVKWKVSGGSWLIEYDRQHIIPAHTGNQGCINGDLKNVVYEDIEPGLVQLKGEFTRYPSVGNYLIMRHSARDHAGMFVFHSKNIKLENINFYHTSGLGILFQYSENTDLKNVNFIPNPHKNRYLSGHDDAFHFMGCRGHINIDSCNFTGLMDDPINIHGTCVPVIERVNDKTLKCRFGHGMSCGLIWAQEGDSVGFILKKNMSTVATGMVEKFTSINKDTFLLSFHQPLPGIIDASFSLENLTCNPSASIRNCYVGSCRARGFLISTPRKVVVENCVFETSGSAILIAGDANYWYENGAVTDLTIRGNEFRAPCNSSYYQFCEAVIAIFPEIPEPDPLLPYHKNITIEHNSFYPSDYPVLFALSVDGLKFSNNTIKRSYLYTPWHHNKNTFTLDACKNVEISDNIIGDDVLGRDILLKRMNENEIKISNTDLRIITSTETD